jgi:hypothetical protein
MNESAAGRITLDSLQLKVVYAYASTATLSDDRPFVLRVRTNDSLYKPYYVVDVAGRNTHTPAYKAAVTRLQRKDGRGELWRAYDKGQQVKVTAPKRYGESQFYQWQDHDGRPLPSNGPELTLTMNAPQDVVAIYLPAPNLDVESEPVAGEPYEGIVTITPNPVSSTGRARLAIARSTHVRLIVVDAQGAELATLLDQAQEPGTVDVSLADIELPSGSYFLRMTTDRTSSVKTFTVTR